MKPDFYLSNFGFSYDAREYGRDEVELHIQSKFQGVRPGGKDYLFQADRFPESKWQVNGQSPWGARACAMVCRGMSAVPNRIDVSMLVSRHVLDFDTVFPSLEEWFKKNKKLTTIETFTTPTGGRKAVFGTRKSRFSLIVLEIPGTPDGELLEITWNIRQDKVMPAWKWLDFYYDGADFYDACKNTFAACTNSILGEDFFGLGLPKDPRLEVTRKADVREDYWGWLSGVASKIKAQARKEESEFLITESVKFLEKELGALLARDIKQHNEKQIRDRQFTRTVV